MLNYSQYLLSPSQDFHDAPEARGSESTDEDPTEVRTPRAAQALETRGKRKAETAAEAEVSSTKRAPSSNATSRQKVMRSLCRAMYHIESTGQAVPLACDYENRVTRLALDVWRLYEVM